MRQLLYERVEKWNPAELVSVQKPEWCDAFFDNSGVVWMKNEEIWVVSFVASSIFLSYLILGDLYTKLFLLIQKIELLQHDVLE